MPTFKIWNSRRNIRRTVQAESLADICLKGGQKLGLTGSIRVVLESDGSEIDEDCVLLDRQGPCAGNILILLQQDEIWLKQYPDDNAITLKSNFDYFKSVWHHASQLRNYIDPDFGLLEELLSTGLLNDEQYSDARSKETSYKRNDCLIQFVLIKAKEELLQLLEALLNTDQGHVANYIRANGEQLEAKYGLERPLGIEEMCKLKANMSFLLQNMIVTEGFIAEIVSSKCIRQQHADYVSVQTTKNQKIVELLAILRRRSMASFKKFIDALYNTHQSLAAEALGKPGVQVPVHINVRIDQITRDKKVIECDLADQLNRLKDLFTFGSASNSNSSRDAQWAEIQQLFLELEMSGIKFQNAKQGNNSIVIFFWCCEAKSLSNLWAMRKSGQLEHMLILTLQYLSRDDEKLSFTLKIDEKDWRLAKYYFNVLESQTKFFSTSPFMELPKEIMETVLIKSLLLLHKATWRSFSYSAVVPYSILTSVCHDWWELIKDRRWFATTTKSYLSGLKSVQHSPVLNILPREVLEMILMRALLSFVHVPWEISVDPLWYHSKLIMSIICHKWTDLITSRHWFAQVMKKYLKKNKHLMILLQHSSIFDRCLDFDFNFLCELHRCDLLSHEQLLEVVREPERHKQTKYLCYNIFLKYNAKKYAEFLNILHLTSQDHIVNYLESNGELDSSHHDERPLNESEIQRMNEARSHLTDFIPSQEFLKDLAKIDCITKNHADYISCLPDGLKVMELIEILKRRSFVSLRKFSTLLRKEVKYIHIADFLTTGNLEEEEKCLKPMELSYDETKTTQDLKAVELTLVEKLLEVAKNLVNGRSIAISDINKIRILWNVLKQLEPQPEKELDSFSCQELPQSWSESDSSKCQKPFELLMEMDDDSENMGSTQWLKCDNFSQGKNSEEIGTMSEQQNNQNEAMLKKSQSETYARWMSNDEIIAGIVNMLFPVVQRNQDTKAAEGTQAGVKECTATLDVILNEQQVETVKTFMARLIKWIEAEKNNPYNCIGDDNMDVLYVRSNSVDFSPNIYLQSDKNRKN